MLLMVEVAAVEVSKKPVTPPEAFKPPPLLLIVALPAVDVSRKYVPPGFAWPDVPPLFTNVVKFPAVALFVNCINPEG